MSTSIKYMMKIPPLTTTTIFLALLLASGLDTVPVEKRLSSEKISPGSTSEESSPVFVVQPLNTFVTEDTHAFLNCSAKFATRIEFHCIPPHFLRDFQSSINKVSHFDNSSGLLFANLEVSYKHVRTVLGGLSCHCRAVGQNGQNATSQNAKIIPSFLGKGFVLGPKALVGSNEIRLKRSGKLQLECAAPNGLPEPTVSWMKDNAIVSSTEDGRVQISRNKGNSSLMIMPAEVEDSGFYSCVASNVAGVRKSFEVDVVVFVDGGWSEWRPWEPDKGCVLEDEHLLCGNGTQNLIRYCDNPPPENGALCTGEHRRMNVRCSKPCPDGDLPRVTCPHSGSHSVNSSEYAVIQLDPPVVQSRYNFTVSMTIDPPGVVPPKFPVAKKPYNVTYTVVTYDKVVVSCSFNITVNNLSCKNQDNCPGRIVCKNGDDCPSTTPHTVVNSRFNVVAVVVAVLGGTVLLGAALAALVRRRMKYHRYSMPEKKEDFPLEHLIDNDSESDVSFIQRKEYRYLSLDSWGKPSEYCSRGDEQCKMANSGDGDSFKILPLKNDLKRQLSDASQISTASEVSRLIWNLTNLPGKADHRHSAWGLVDHNGGLLTIADCGVSLLVPPMAIPEGRTEAVFIALMKEDGEYPCLTEKQSLLSPVVVCGPNGIKFNRPVTLTLPHCAAFQDDNSWNLSVYCNENGSGDDSDWKKLLNVATDDPNQSSLLLMEQKSCHLMVDHFTDFVLVGESASGQQAVRNVKILAYFTPPKVNTDCVVRVYCVADSPDVLKILHDQEKVRLGETIDAPKPFNFRDGGGNLQVDVVDHQNGWQAVTAKHKEIGFRNIWNGIERMNCCSFLFTQENKSEPRFSCSFKVQQSGEDSDEQEVIVATGVQRDQKGLVGDLTCANCEIRRGHRTSSSSSITAFVDHYTASTVGNHMPRKVDYKHLSFSSGYSSGMETLQSAFCIPQEVRNELILLLDPPHFMDWRVLAERLGFQRKQITWIKSRCVSPTETILNLWEESERGTDPLRTLVNILRDMGRDDAADEIEKVIPRETRL